MSLIILKHKKRATRQWLAAHTCWDLSLIVPWLDDDYDYYDDDEIIKWYEGYKESKAQKAKI